MISQHYLTFPLYVPRIIRLFSNWPHYVFNYVSRRKSPATYKLRNGYQLVDEEGTLAGTIAVVFIRREYGLVRRFKTIVDIGANMGSFAVYSAYNEPSAKIYCYEPEQKNFAILKQNIAINSLEKRVSVFQDAVASCAGRRELVVDTSPMHSLVSGNVDGLRQTVNCTTLQDIFVNNRLKKIDLLKMNCEGAEYEIIEHCSSTDFQRIFNIRLEYHNLDDQTKNGKSLALFLKARGYTINRFTRYRGISGFIWASRT
jgi:FkbM family methyltransferase